MSSRSARSACTIEAKVFLSLMCGLVIWLFVALPLIGLPAERLGELPQKASLLAAVAGLCATATTVAALFVARGQLILNRENQRETTSKTIFREFLKLCVEHPDFAYGNNQDGPRYEWFVAHFLWAAEEILEYAPTAWEPNLRLYVSYHRDYLQKNQRFRSEDWPTYTPRLRDFVDRALSSLPPAGQQKAAVSSPQDDGESP
jgi:hypothetical protein